MLVNLWKQSISGKIIVQKIVGNVPKKIFLIVYHKSEVNQITGNPHTKDLVHELEPKKMYIRLRRVDKI